MLALLRFAAVLIDHRDAPSLSKIKVLARCPEKTSENHFTDVWVCSAGKPRFSRGILGWYRNAKQKGLLPAADIWLELLGNSCESSAWLQTIGARYTRFNLHATLFFSKVSMTHTSAPNDTWRASGSNSWRSKCFMAST